jgi:hypothetical protein
VLNVHGVHNVRKEDIHTAEPLVPEPSLVEVETAIGKLKSYKKPGWATGWTIGILGFDSRRGLGSFLFTTASRTALGPTQPPIQCVSGGPLFVSKATGA